MMLQSIDIQHRSRFVDEFIWSSSIPTCNKLCTLSYLLSWFGLGPFISGFKFMYFNQKNVNELFIIILKRPEQMKRRWTWKIDKYLLKDRDVLGYTTTMSHDDINRYSGFSERLFSFAMSLKSFKHYHLLPNFFRPGMLRSLWSIHDINVIYITLSSKMKWNKLLHLSTIYGPSIKYWIKCVHGVHYTLCYLLNDKMP